MLTGGYCLISNGNTPNAVYNSSDAKLLTVFVVRFSGFYTLQTVPSLRVYAIFCPLRGKARFKENYIVAVCLS